VKIDGRLGVAWLGIVAGLVESGGGLRAYSGWCGHCDCRTAGDTCDAPAGWIRGGDGQARQVGLAAMVAGTFIGSVPWRTFRWRRGQRHFSGLYWSATMNDHVVYESRLELARLLFADRDAVVAAIYAQPFLLTATVDGVQRRHVPDFLLAGADGELLVVDVKPRRRLADATVAATLAWAGELVRDQGWGFEVWSEPDPVVLANVRFLAGYRRPELFDPVILAAVQAVTAGPVGVGQVEQALVTDWPVWRVRPHVLHLLWSGHLAADLGRPLAGTSLVRWAR
jgi:hypothetical protein